MLPLIDRGQGDTALVMMHFFGNSHREWLDVIEHLGAAHRCIALDLPGFGDAADRDGFDTRAMADQVAQTIEALGLERVVLIGHSFSGKVAMVLAARRPEWLASMVLVAPAPALPQPVSDEEREFQQAFDHSREQAEAFIDGAIAQPLSPARYHDAVEDAMRASPEAWQAWPRHGSREDVSVEVGVLEYPALIVVGDQDPSLPPRTQRELVLGQFAAPRLEIIPDHGHLLPVEMPQALAALIDDFVGHDGQI
ncbi:alpha/beta fold hydrolase [Kushneria indalinina]|uniref:Pimeloyl-ACP methyl ester carboxylesterase n=1 Tax=Kushneria indalinina DSM 14324 TaxID=1122140 RepID=A0A3D9DU69_9GAMM|nr:alpha/beta fold hydrolase [Kushneria indalinina]REC93934.1 pimeloyl-ACP methyl ester carboxylesterase [Kushneria indalinina DSM 14324]